MAVKKKVAKKKVAKPAEELTTRDISPAQAVDFLIRQACMVIPQGMNPQDAVKEYEAIGAKIKKALKK